MTLLKQDIEQWLATTVPNDQILISFNGDLETGNGVILERTKEGASVWRPDGCKVFCASASDVIDAANAWFSLTGEKMPRLDQTPNSIAGSNEPLIRDQLILCCYRHGMPEDETRPMLEDLLDELAAWLDQRHSGSSQTADLLRAIFP